MSATESLKSVIRMLELMRCLGRFDKTAGQLHEELGFDVSKRTVERDLKALAEAFPAHILCNDKSQPYGWRKAGDILSSMSLSDALSLQVIERTLKPLLPASVLDTLTAGFDEARAKLDKTKSDNHLAAWANKVRSVQPVMPMLSPKVDPDVLREVQEALLHEVQIDVEYQKRGASEAKKMPLNPLALVQRGLVSYLIATAKDYTEPYLYALHRMRSAQRNSFAIPKIQPAFDLDAYLAQGKLQFSDDEASGQQIVLEARVAEWLKKILEETPLSEDQRIEDDDGRWRLTATVRDSSQLKWWLLSQGCAIEVLAPAPLRERIAQSLKSAAQAYA